MTQRQSGIALLEALIASALVGATLLGLLHMQMRTLADSENALHRAQALHLIDDLGNRIRTNPAGFQALGSFTSAWGDSPAPDTDCQAQWCNPGQLAQWDLARWKKNIAHALPRGDATVFDVGDPGARASRRTLGVMVAWHSRTGERFEISVSGASCPGGLVCQFGYVQP